MMFTGPTVLIDGAVPHDNRERCTMLLDYAESLLTDRKLSASIERLRADVGTLPDEFEFWNEIEDETIEEINALLPDDHVCTLGESQPGEVIVRERDREEV